MNKKLVRSFLSLVMAGGLVMAAWPLGQNAYNAWSQKKLFEDFENERAHRKPTSPEKAAAKTPGAKTPGAKSQTASLSDAAVQKGSGTKKKVAEKLPKTRLRIPDIGVDAIVVSGIDEASLKRGPGHFPGSALPGQSGNCAIAGHRNVYGSWFYKVDNLFPGQSIFLETPDAEYEYRVIGISSVVDTDNSVLAPPAPENGVIPAVLTLVTCTIPHSTDRIIIKAQRPPE